jgi:hypothetical protein
VFRREIIADKVCQAFMDGDHFICRSGKRAQQTDVIAVTRQQHPVAVTASNNRSWIHTLFLFVMSLQFGTDVFPAQA